jgi:hypothetical protein
MTVKAISAVLLGLATVFAASNVWTRETAPRPSAAVELPRAETTSFIDNAPPNWPSRDDDWAEPRVDIHGNEVDVAVGDYRVDRQGELYERHAPDTALLHLSAPRM